MCGLRHDESTCPNQTSGSEDEKQMPTDEEIKTKEFAASSTHSRTAMGGAVGSDGLVMTTLARGWWTPKASNGSFDVPQAVRRGRPPAGGVIAVGQVGQ